MCLFKRTIEIDCGKAQLARIFIASPLIVEDLITMRNVFLYCLEGRSPNGYRPGDSREVVEALGEAAENRLWPHGIFECITQASGSDSEETLSTFEEI
ncbi:hypothetical protein GOBAR_DD14556 [Gossypium barbadense]|nr:hypothetical protein GOBAR_DD14556 [Gossypium barbadense]